MTSGTHSGDAIEFMYDARGRFDDDDLHTLGERMLARNPITGGPPAGFTYLCPDCPGRPGRLRSLLICSIPT